MNERCAFQGCGRDKDDMIHDPCFYSGVCGCHDYMAPSTPSKEDLQKELDNLYWLYNTINDTCDEYREKANKLGRLASDTWLKSIALEKKLNP